jgi:microcystin-dependent protein
MTSILRRSSAFSAHEKPVTGDIKMSFVGEDHLGWLKCDGRSFLKTEKPLLYNVIGIQFGGSATAFNLPNPAGGVLGVVGQRGDEGSVTTTLHGPGSEVGEETHTLDVDEMPAHTHTGTTEAAGFATTPVNVINTVVAAATSIDVADNGAGGHTHTFTTNSTGGGEAHNNMQPTLFIGNVFIFSGVPTAGSYPGTVGLNPPLI